MKKAGVNTEEVQRCLKESFVMDRSGNVKDNTLLKEDRDWSNLMGTFMHPSVTINNITYRGDLNGYDIFKAVCAGFQDMPTVCKGDNIFEVMAELENKPDNQRGSHFAKGYHIVGAIIIVMLFNFAALYAYRRYHKKKMNAELQMQVNSAVSQYFKLSG